jgi:oxygen-independent coproporphyrinogen III oxidase
MELSLYVHIPFCGSRCPYCDFAFVVRKTNLAPRYVDAIVRELDARVPDVARINTIYFGGGTPSEIPTDLLGGILDHVADRWTVASDAEITAEANPDDASCFTGLRQIGANRLSLGAQAMDNATLKALGRRHTAEQTHDAYQAAREAGFRNVNLDLIFGAPGQTTPEWTRSLDVALSWEPEHFSVYGLTIEAGTAFHRRKVKGTLQLPGEEAETDMYTAALDRLADAGYRQYEVSNFATPGQESTHNLAYWHRRPYLGVGLSAHSFVDGARSWNTTDLSDYLTQVESSGVAVDGTETESSDSRFVEEVLLGLRMPEGIPEALIADIDRSRGLERLAGAHLVERTRGRVRLTRKGLLLADLVCAELVSDS